MRTNSAVQIVEYPSTEIDWAIMNSRRLLTPEVRQGFSYAFPYDDVQNAVYNGLLKPSGPIPDNVRGYDPDVFIY
jgi:ABC-type transport system substrate-binding protein